MSNNISTMYTKSQNLKAGRKGYVAWKTEKELDDFMKYSGSLMDKE